MSVTNSNFEETLVHMCLARVSVAFSHTKVIVSHRYIYYTKKILNYLKSVMIRILGENRIIYIAHFLLVLLVQTCSFLTTSLCLNTRLREKF